MGAPQVPAPRLPALRLLLRLLLLVMLVTRSGCAVPCVSGGLPKPTNVTFLSINMKNILQWSPPPTPRGAEVTYTVQYFIYGQKTWMSKPECRNINRTYCDLSAETSDYEHQYYAKVKAILETNCSMWAETGRFFPFLETQIGPPEVALTTGEKSISIVLTAPEKWKRNPEDSTVSMQEIFSNLKYNVSIYSTKSKKMWSQSITNHTLVLNWLEPNTLYCIHVESLVPGPPRLPQPSQKHCVRTLEDQSSALKVKIIIWYVLPTSIIVFLFSVIGYSIYRYIHVGKEKHPANLVLIYGNEIDKRFFVPVEKIMINFITLSCRDDPRISQKALSLLKESSHDPEPNGNPKPLLEEVDVEHLGYASHLVDICDTEESIREPSLVQCECLSSIVPTGKADIDYEYDVRTDFCGGPEDHQQHGREEAARHVRLSEHQTVWGNPSPQTLLSSRIYLVHNLHHLPQEHTSSAEGPEEEPSTTLVDWDPQTGRLCIPSFPSCHQDPEGCEHFEGNQVSEDSLLSRLCEKPTPDEPSEENDNYLLQFMEEWGLHVQMEN